MVIVIKSIIEEYIIDTFILLNQWKEIYSLFYDQYFISIAAIFSG